MKLEKIIRKKHRSIEVLVFVSGIMLSLSVYAVSSEHRGLWKCVGGDCNEAGFFSVNLNAKKEIALFQYGSAGCHEFGRIQCQNRTCSFKYPTSSGGTIFEMEFQGKNQVRIQNMYFGVPTRTANSISIFEKVSDKEIPCYELTNYLSIHGFIQ